MSREKPKSPHEQVKERFQILCRKCGSDDVYFDYEAEGGYSEYTQWGSAVSFRCAKCNDNDLFVESA